MITSLPITGVWWSRKKLTVMLLFSSEKTTRSFTGCQLNVEGINSPAFCAFNQGI
jgi:hypothetical protein